MVTGGQQVRGRQAEDEVMKSQTIQDLYRCGRNLHAKSETLTVVPV